MSHPTKTHTEIRERNRALVRDYQGGMSLQAVGKVYGVTYERVRQILRAAGVPRRSPGGQTYRTLRVPRSPLRPWRQEIAERLRELRLTKG